MKALKNLVVRIYEVVAVPLFCLLMLAFGMYLIGNFPVLEVPIY